MSDSSSSELVQASDDEQREAVENVAAQAHAVSNGAKTVSRIQSIKSAANTLRRAFIAYFFVFALLIVSNILVATLRGTALPAAFDSLIVAAASFGIGLIASLLGFAYLFVGVYGVRLRSHHAELDDEIAGKLTGSALLVHFVQALFMLLAGISILGAGYHYLVTVLG